MQKFFAKCEFDCGFISRKKGEEISAEKFEKLKASLPPESLLQFVLIQEIEIKSAVPVIQAIKKSKKESVK